MSNNPSQNPSPILRSTPLQSPISSGRPSPVLSPGPAQATPPFSPSPKDVYENFTYKVPRAIRTETLEKSILSPGEYEYITLKGIGEPYLFARVGVEDDGICLFHAVVLATLYEEYIQHKNENKLDEFVKMFRDSFFDDVPSEKWFMYADAEWQSNMLRAFVNKVDDLVAPKTWWNWLFLSSQRIAIQQAVDSVLEQSVDLVKFQVEVCTALNMAGINIDENQCILLVGSAIEQAYTEYKEQVVQGGGCMGTPEIQLMMDIFNINIFVYDKKGELYDDRYLVNQPSIILYNQGGDHWEPIARIVQQDDDIQNTQQFVFPPDAHLTRYIINGN